MEGTGWGGEVESGEETIQILSANRMYVVVVLVGVVLEVDLNNILSGPSSSSSSSPSFSSVLVHSLVARPEKGTSPSTEEVYM